MSAWVCSKGVSAMAEDLSLMALAAWLRRQAEQARASAEFDADEYGARATLKAAARLEQAPVWSHHSHTLPCMSWSPQAFNGLLGAAKRAIGELGPLARDIVAKGILRCRAGSAAELPLCLRMIGRD
jgi:hypothetical protein